MREHLIKSRTVETAIRDRVQRDFDPKNPTHRVALELWNLRLAAMDDLLQEVEGEHPNTAFQAAMERIRQHFDKDGESPYKSFRGATPPDQPSLPKDIAIMFEQLMLEGVWYGNAPQLDPRWDPS
jgi:hypothetical protein